MGTNQLVALAMVAVASFANGTPQATDLTAVEAGVMPLQAYPGESVGLIMSMYMFSLADDLALLAAARRELQTGPPPKHYGASQSHFSKCTYMGVGIRRRLKFAHNTCVMFRSPQDQVG